MAFDIILQTNQSERERLTKSLTDVISVSGTLKTDTSIIDPIIVIECDLAAVVTVNYLTIPAFGRSYFVNNIRSIRHDEKVKNGLVEFSCHVDVLSSFAEQIRANTAIIRKQEKDWNLYLNDGSLRVYQNPTIITKLFPAGFNTQEFVLAVAGS